MVTGDDGGYECKNIPPGTYDVHAHLDRVPEVMKTISVGAGVATDASFRLRLRGAGTQVVVTASAGEESSLLAVQPVLSLSSLVLTEKSTESLGAALDNQLGIAKRTFGPGTARPVVRGFDGDRVLVLQDGNRVGGLGFQTGDHAEPIDVMTLDKIKVVKGPATLLYGSSAIGGVVNAMTGLHDSHPGVRGYLTGMSGTNSYPAGGSGGGEFGAQFGNLGRNVLIGPDQRRIDLVISKLTRVNERVSLGLRGDAFNNPTFREPDSAGRTINDASFGDITRTRGGPRVIQLGLKMRF
jgi:iron complex outermembrane receptor protein